MSLKLRHPLADYNGDQGLDLELSGQVGEHYYKLFSHSCHTGLLLSLKVQNFSSVEFSPKSKQMRKYSQSGIKDKSLKMPVCEDFRFLALLNTYSVVKHAVLRNNRRFEMGRVFMTSISLPNSIFKQKFFKQ